MGDGMGAYAVLGVRPGAGAEEIRTAYRRLALTLHPDRQEAAGDRAATDAEFRDVTDAYRAALTAASRVTSASVQRQVDRAVRDREPTRTLVRDADPMATLLSLPRRCGGTWTSSSLEVWALTLVPEARSQLRRAEDLAELAGARTRDDFVLATVHALVALTFTGRTARRAAAVAPHLPEVYLLLEAQLPRSVVSRLRAAVRHR